MGDPIVDALKAHEWRPDWPGANIGECAAKCDGGDGDAEFTYDGHADHVADAIRTTLGLTEETQVDYQRIPDSPLIRAGGIEISIKGAGQGYAECGLCGERLAECYAHLVEWAEAHAREVHDAQPMPRKSRLVGEWRPIEVYTKRGPMGEPVDVELRP